MQCHTHWRRQLWGTGARASPSLDFQLFNFLVTSDAALTLTLDSMWLPTQKEDTGNTALSLFIAWISQLLFLCVALKLFALSFVPLLAPSHFYLFSQTTVLKSMTIKSSKNDNIQTMRLEDNTTSFTIVSRYRDVHVWLLESKACGLARMDRYSFNGNKNS